MNYDEHIARLIAALTTDKSIPQPYRNSVASTARRLQLEIRGAKSMTLRQEDGRVDATIDSSKVCTCRAGVIEATCPVHGNAVS